MNWSQLLSPGFYFSYEGLHKFDHTTYVFIWGIFLIAFGLAFSLYRKKVMTDNLKKKLTKNYSGRLVWFGIIALVLLWFREESLRILSLRVWWLIYGLSFVLAIVVSYKNFKRKYIVRIQEKPNENLEKKKKYLPQMKNKKKKK